MTSLVVDASVAAKWILPDEPLADVAAALRERVTLGRVEASVPDLFWPEMTNFLWHAVRRVRVTAATAGSSLADLHQLGLETVSTSALAEKALELSLQYEHPAYDMFYAALALELGIEVITADERFVRAVGSRLPVRWLGTAVS